MPKLGRMIFKRMGRDSVERFLLSLLKQYQQERRSEEALWCRIVTLAWQDAFYKPSVSKNDGEVSKVKRDAIKFLTEGDGFLAHRETCCENSELSPDWIRQAALKALKDGPPQPSPPRCCDGREQNDFTGLRRSINKSMTVTRKKKAKAKSGAELWSSIKEGTNG